VQMPCLQLFLLQFQTYLWVSTVLRRLFPSGTP